MPGGPTGWQIACAAFHQISQFPDATVRAALLAACYERVPPGVVAGRANGFGAMPLGAASSFISQRGSRSPIRTGRAR
ncbi:MAG: hypothetical protein M3680_13950 [Myxococcota bacterium]|nr:hypothetical protein [Myxococcota bacterium]